MKNIILVVILVIVVAGTASPLLIARNIESTLQANVDKVNETNFYTATIDSFESGYLKSNAVVSIGFDMERLLADMTPEERDAIAPMLESMSSVFQVGMDIDHGPLLDAPERSFGLFHTTFSLPGLPDLPDEISVLFADAGPTTATLTMGMVGDGEFLFTVPAFEQNGIDSFVSFGGIDFRADLEDMGLVYEGGGAVNDILIEIVDNDVDLHMSPITLVMSGDMREGMIGGTGDFELDLTELRYTADDGDFALDHLTMTTVVSNPAENTIDVDYGFGLELMEGSFLEESLSDVDLNFAIRNLDKEAVISAYERMMDLDYNQDPAVLQQQMNDIIVAIYGGADYHIKRFGFQYGEDVAFEMSANFSIDQQIFANPLVVQNPMLAVSAMDMDISMKSSQGFTSMALEQFLRQQLEAQELSEEEIEQFLVIQRPQAEAMVGQLVQSGTLIETADGYSIDISLTDGNLLINGAPSSMIPFL